MVKFRLVRFAPHRPHFIHGRLKGAIGIASTIFEVLSGRLSLDISGFNQAIGKATEAAKGFSSRLSASFKPIQAGLGNVAKAATALAAGFAAIGVAAVKSAAETRNTQARLEAALRSTGKTADVTAGFVNKMADQLQRVTKFSGGTTKEMAALLLSFKKIQGEDIFGATIKAAQDLSEAVGVGSTAAVQSLGRALNDPARGIVMLTRLTRGAITVTKEQRDEIAALVAAGKTQEAQWKILTMVQDVYGGRAEAAGKTAVGTWVRFKNALSESVESLGGPLLDRLIPVLDKVTELGWKLKDWIDANDELMHQGLDQFLDGVAPIVERTGAAFSKVWEVAQPLFAGLTDGVGRLWQQAQQVFSSLPTWAQDLVLVGGTLTTIGIGLTTIGGKIPFFGQFVAAVGALVNPIGIIKGALAVISPLVGGMLAPVAALTGAMALAVSESESANETWQSIKNTVAALIGGAGSGLSGLWQWLKDNAAAIKEDVVALGELGLVITDTLLKVALPPLKIAFEGIKLAVEAVVSAVRALINILTGDLQKALDSFTNLSANLYQKLYDITGIEAIGDIAKTQRERAELQAGQARARAGRKGGWTPERAMAEQAEKQAVEQKRQATFAASGMSIADFLAAEKANAAGPGAVPAAAGAGGMMSVPPMEVAATMQASAADAAAGAVTGVKKKGKGKQQELQAALDPETFGEKWGGFFAKRSSEEVVELFNKAKDDITGALKPDADGVIDPQFAKRLLDNYSLILSNIEGLNEGTAEEFRDVMSANIDKIVEAPEAMRGQLLEALDDFEVKARDVFSKVGKYGKDAAEDIAKAIKEGAKDASDLLEEQRRKVAKTREEFFDAVGGGLDKKKETGEERFKRIGAEMQAEWQKMIGKGKKGGAKGVAGGGRANAMLEMPDVMGQTMGMMQSISGSGVLGAAAGGAASLQRAISEADPLTAINLMIESVQGRLNQSLATAAFLGRDPAAGGGFGGFAGASNAAYQLSLGGGVGGAARGLQDVLKFLLEQRELLLRAKPMAMGGIVTRPTLALLGEDGPEEVVPVGRGRRSHWGGVTVNVNLPNARVTPALAGEIADALERELGRRGTDMHGRSRLRSPTRTAGRLVNC